MAKPRRKPSFVHDDGGEQEICVGEFHCGSATDPEVLEPGKGVKLFLTDPPYNLGFDYGPEVDDKQPETDYHQMMEDIIDACYDAADEDAHFFMIHYPQDIAKMWGRITKKWKFNQWITWAYPANFGHSSDRWTNASRTVLWLVKGEPEFYGDRVVQPYRNPTDKRIKKLIHEEGRKGTNLYNWWVVNLCKNVSKDKRNYSNQIPEELLERIILSTTNMGDLVGDPFSGTFSTCRTAMRLARRAWGCDLNSEVIKWRPVKTDYSPEPVKDLDSKEPIEDQKLVGDTVFYKYKQAGLTDEQFEKLVVELLDAPDWRRVMSAPGIGEKKAKEFTKERDRINRGGGPGMDEF